MHLEPNNERTPSDIKRLKLKGFHKRQILVKVIKSFLDCKTPKQEVIQGVGSYHYYTDSEFCYVLEEVKSGIFAIKKTISKRFNKQQLPGKLILINGEYYRIC